MLPSVCSCILAAWWCGAGTAQHNVPEVGGVRVQHHTWPPHCNSLPVHCIIGAALNEEAGKLLLDGFDEFAKKARLMTSIHAKKPSVLTAAGGANALNADGTAAAADAKPAAAASGSSTAATAGVATKASKAAASKLAEKKKSLRRL
jgi:ubiquitin-conjugating enzyme E2 S